MAACDSLAHGGTAEGLENFKQQFLGGLKSAVAEALLAAPQYLLIGISLEHILMGIGLIRETMAKTERKCPLGWSTEHEAIKSALDCFGAKRRAHPRLGKPARCHRAMRHEHESERRP